MRAIRLALQLDDWPGLIALLGLASAELEDLGLGADSTDRAIWRECQRLGAVLVTGDRTHADGEESMGRIVESEGDGSCLPVLILADPPRATRDPRHALRCGVRLLDYGERLDELRGTGRLFLP